jgi:hypothetical protein
MHLLFEGAITTATSFFQLCHPDILTAPCGVRLVSVRQRRLPHADARSCRNGTQMVRTCVQRRLRVDPRLRRCRAFVCSHPFRTCMAALPWAARSSGQGRNRAPTFWGLGQQLSSCMVHWMRWSALAMRSCMTTAQCIGACQMRARSSAMCCNLCIHARCKR